MRGNVRAAIVLLILIMPACRSTGDARATGTPLTLPSPTPFAVVRSAATATRAPTTPPLPRPTIAVAPALTATPAPTAAARAHAQITPTASGKLTYANAPAVIAAALQSAGITAQVYWFTFDAGDREEALMIQYDSPLINRAGYDEMLLKVKTIAAQNYLKIDPPLYSLFIAATDLTGTSDSVVRLRRAAVERWARGEIGAADLFNNGFEPARIVVTCSGNACSVRMATPYPTFPSFPFPFPLTPTP